VWFANDHLIGGKNGKPFGMMSNTVQKNVVYKKSVNQKKLKLIDNYLLNPGWLKRSFKHTSFFLNVYKNIVSDR
jgi:hypothetical protein